MINPEIPPINSCSIQNIDYNPETSPDLQNIDTIVSEIGNNIQQNSNLLHGQNMKIAGSTLFAAGTVTLIGTGAAVAAGFMIPMVILTPLVAVAGLVALVGLAILVAGACIHHKAKNSLATMNKELLVFDPQIDINRQTVTKQTTIDYENQLNELDKLKNRFGVKNHIVRPDLKADLDKRFLWMPIHTAKAMLTKHIKDNTPLKVVARLIAKKLGMSENGQSKYEYASIMIQGLAFYKANKKEINNVLSNSILSNTEKQIYIEKTLGFSYHPNLNKAEGYIYNFNEFLETFESHYAFAKKQLERNPDALYNFFNNFFSVTAVCFEARHRYLQEYLINNPLPEPIDENAPRKAWDEEIICIYPDDTRKHKFDTIFGQELMAYIEAYKKHNTNAAIHWMPTGKVFKHYLIDKKDIYNIEAMGEPQLNGQPQKFTEEKLDEIIASYIDDGLLE